MGPFRMREPSQEWTMPSVTHARLLAAKLAIETDAAVFTQNEAVKVWYGAAPTEMIFKSVFAMSFSEAANALDLYNVAGGL